MELVYDNVEYYYAKNLDGYVFWSRAEQKQDAYKYGNPIEKYRLQIKEDLDDYYREVEGKW